MEREASTPAPHLSASQILQIATQLSTTANGANGPASEGGADLQRSASVGAQSTGSGANREPLDPKWIEIMMGKDDAVRMRDCGKILRDPAKSTDEKLAAFDELEMVNRRFLGSQRGAGDCVLQNGLLTALFFSNQF